MIRLPLRRWPAIGLGSDDAVGRGDCEARWDMLTAEGILHAYTGRFGAALQGSDLGGGIGLCV